MKPHYIWTPAGPLPKGATPDLMEARLQKRRRTWRMGSPLDECSYLIRFGARGPLRDSAIALKAQLLKPTTTTGEPA